MNLKHPYYKHRPIGSIPALARALGISTSKLKQVSRTADRTYRGPIRIKKACGKYREVFSASVSLRDIQQRILDRILRHACYPDYLLGGLKGYSYIDNAQRHSGARILFGQDIDAFYPSITRHHTSNIFRDVFKFPKDVADLLSKLLTRCGVLVQGGVASTHMANLSLYRTEAELERQVRRRGMRYSRYVDDIHISSTHVVAHSEITHVVALVRKAMEREGFKPKRSKQFVVTASRRMQVHRLNVNGRASTPVEHRRALRNEVFLLERWAEMESWSAAMEKCFLRLSSRVGHLKLLNQGEAHRLKTRLNRLSPFRAHYLRMPVTTVGSNFIDTAEVA